jgi:NADH:ubiquinone oxidoreductase subunit F (NADH-binding)
VLAHGADEFRSGGTTRSPGTTVYTVSGDVRAPGIRELPLGTPLGQVIDEVGGGVGDGRSVKMVMSGVANPAMTAAHLSTPADFDSLGGAGGRLGSGGFVVYDDTMCAVAVAQEYSRFLSVESCGQCPPCKLQSGHVTVALAALLAGDDPAAQLPVVRRSLDTVTDGARCYLASEEQQVVASLLQAFPDDVHAHETGTCSLRHDVLVPKIVDLAPDGFVLDERHRLKRPDWTYADDDTPRART